MARGVGVTVPQTRMAFRSPLCRARPRPWSRECRCHGERDVPENVRPPSGKGNQSTGHWDTGGAGLVPAQDLHLCNGRLPGLG